MLSYWILSQEFQSLSLAASELTPVLYSLSDQLITVPPVTCQEKPQPDKLVTGDMLKETTRESSHYSLVQLLKVLLFSPEQLKTTQKSSNILAETT